MTIYQSTRSGASPEQQITRFCRQYLQLELDLDYPDGEVLRDEATQNTLYSRLFDGQVTPPRYRLRALKELVARIESSISDWDKHGISDRLMSTLTELLVAPLPSEISAVQQKFRVIYHLSLLDRTLKDANITLLESRTLLSASGTTGLRTWEAALHLGQYLCANPSLVRGKRILELGAGTGYLGVLCTRYLGARHVIASDGSEDVIRHLPDNLFLNGLQDSDKITPMELRWGHALLGTEEQHWNGGRDVDIVIGADITYDSRVNFALVGTLEEIVVLYPEVTVLIAATERNYETFKSFLLVWEKRGFEVSHATFPVPPRSVQAGPFYDGLAPIRICQLRHAGKK